MSRLRILIVEDEPVIAEHIAAYLNNADFEVSAVVYDMEEAKKEMETNTPDAAILDINLQSANDGIDLAGWIKGRYRLPFLFLTAHADKYTLERAKKVKPAGYIVKPFNESTLQASLEIAISNYAQEQNHDQPLLRPDKINRRLLSPLSERELEVAQLVYYGITNTQITERLFVSVNAVKTHLKNIYLKLDVNTRVGMISRLRELMQE